ncbi:MAG: hypothetical protein Q4D07_04870 [Selenomonadaceae bacterium]|nr:hypothetical protein [Selenomonadaceae bacterium]
MALKQLQKNENGFVCPQCNQNLRFVDGGAVRIVNGKLDMDNAKAKYECYNCNIFYREVMNTGYYDVFPLEKQPESARPAERISEGEQQIARAKMFCPQCGRLMVPEFDGEAVPKGSKMPEGIEATYHCEDCDTLYREAIISGTRHTLAWYTPSSVGGDTQEKPSEVLSAVVSSAESSPALAQVSEEKKDKEDGADTAKRVLKSTGDLPPMELKKNENGRCECPRCGGSMKYIEGQPVRIVDGKPTFDDVLDHFSCPDCKSVFRRIVGTNYFQFSEK